MDNHILANRIAARGRWFVWLVVLAVVLAGLLRYVKQPSFWLDEAFVAVSLKQASVQAIFSRLEYGQYFPRLYLLLIAALREAFGYRIWAVRLLPFLCFVTATGLWAKWLLKRSGAVFVAALLSAAFLLGASYWLDQAIQLKPYTFDVGFGLMPFLLGDDFYKKTFAEGRGKWMLLVLALPCAFSYTYPLSLGARLAGWYLYRGRRAGWRIQPSAIALFAVASLLALTSIYLTDHRFNFQDREAYLVYWSDCLLRVQFQKGPGSGLRLIAKFLWGWHGRQPLVTLVMVPLQIIGVYWVIRRWRKAEGDSQQQAWGSRSLGSLGLLLGVIAASLFANYPLCAGRVTLFAQAHTQILALEGALFAWTVLKKQRLRAILFTVLIGILLFHSGREYLRFVKTEPAENLNPVLPFINPEITDKIWVHPCSIAQVRALPEALPGSEIVLDDKPNLPNPGEKVWVLWSHLGAQHCQAALEEIRQKAVRWQVIHEGAGRGLALAEF
jgi:hypothetical protein